MPTFLGPFTFGDMPEQEYMKNLNLVSSELKFLNPPGTINLSDVLLLGTRVVQILVNVKTKFTGGSPTLTIGTNSNPSKYGDNAAVDLSETGVYLMMPLDILEIATQVKAFWNPDGVTEGEAEIFAIIAEP